VSSSTPIYLLGIGGIELKISLVHHTHVIDGFYWHYLGSNSDILLGHHASVADGAFSLIFWVPGELKLKSHWTITPVSLMGYFHLLALPGLELGRH
jgi:hypothetical protein